MIPDYQTLMLPVLRLAATGETRVADVSERVADNLGLTQAERDELLPSGRQRLLHNRIHWAKFYMSKAGLIASPARGRFVATDKGKALLATSPACARIQRHSQIRWDQTSPWRWHRGHRQLRWGSS
ncbi:winged helix-turn-helix domain-containing protein [Rhizobium sp. RU36D]|uniref:winged helix-turn-helix domain-containing protein n=1 Tax=Rhizobium sp. RU36D TaxID=1907415 RepID=UPI0009FFA09D|nr:winged helix-turn-helix domain-containing protein [Rhizobium sp. RU36D]